MKDGTIDDIIQKQNKSAQLMKKEQSKQHSNLQSQEQLVVQTTTEANMPSSTQGQLVIYRNQTTDKNIYRPKTTELV